MQAGDMNKMGSSMVELASILQQDAKDCPPLIGLT